LFLKAPLKKKTTQLPLSFATEVVLTPQGKKKTRGTSLKVPRQRKPSQN